MVLQEVEKIHVIVQYTANVNKISRKSLLELMRRYEDFYTNNPDEYMVDFNTFLNLYGNDDLADDLHPDEEDIVYASCDMIDVIEDLLDEYDIDIPDDDRGEDTDAARIYGEVYYNIEEAFKKIIRNLLNGDDEE